MNRLALLIMLILISQTDSTAVSYSRLTLGSCTMETPEEGQISFGAGQVYFGRTHVNGNGRISVFGRPTFQDFYSQSGDAIENLSEMEYENVFTGGMSLGYPELVFTDTTYVSSIRSSCGIDHRFSGTVGGNDITTSIVLMGDHYRAMQYYTNLTTPNDTIVFLPWTERELPYFQRMSPVIVIDGVCRVKGVVSGRLTILSSDSLFIMGDIITDDIFTSFCENERLFGTVPNGSQNRIGLIGLKDVIIAATLENGFANGEMDPSSTCGFVNEPVLTLCSQSRQDVVITASIIAHNCTFEAEFWKTTASNANIPSINDQDDGCTGQNNTEISIFNCGSSTSDRRGSVYLHGSVVTKAMGFFKRSGPSPWGTVTIGYDH
jgi:hypothetical protein